MSNPDRKITYTHWLPLITRCPVNGLLDLCWVKITSPDLVDLYQVRKAIFSYSWKKQFMEEVAQGIFDKVSSLVPIDRPVGSVTVISLEMTLWFNRHKIILGDLQWNKK